MKHYKKLLALALSLVLLLGVLPIGAAAADSGHQLQTTEAFGYLGLEVTPYVGGLEDANLDLSATTSTSCWANIFLSNKEKVVPEKTAYGLKAEASFASSVPWGCHLEVWYTLDDEFIKDGGSPESKNTAGLKKVAASIATIPFVVEDNGSGSVVYYIYGVLLNESGDVLKYTNLSCEVSYVHEKTSSIHYTRAGFQARTVDGTPLGQYNYAYHPNKEANTDGIYQDEGALGTYDGMDGKQWSNAYFDLTYQDTKAGKILGNLAEVQQNIRRVLTDAGKPKQGTSIVVTGPAYVQTTGGAKGTQVYNMEYYTGKNNEDILKYASWGAGTKSKDFVEHGMQTATIPLPPLGRVIIRCWDVDDMTAPIYETMKEVSDFAAISDAGTFNTVVSAAVDAYNHAISQIPGGRPQSIMRNQSQFDFAGILSSAPLEGDYEKAVENVAKVQSDSDEIKDVLSQYVPSPITGALNTNPHLTDAYFTAVATSKVARDNAIEDTLKKNETVAASVSFVEVKPLTAEDAPELEGYVFDYGTGQDTLTKMGSGNMVMVGSQTSAEVVVSDQVQNVIVHLYYRADAPTTYTVKVRKSGIVYEDYTRTYESHTNVVITEDMVDTSVVPEGWKIQDITPDSLTLKKDPSKNIIYIDCETSGYTVKVRFNGTILEEYTTSFPADPGTVITEDNFETPEIPEDWTITGIDTIPLTVDPDPTKNIIYIDCTDPAPAAGKVTYNYYLNGTLTDTIVEDVDVGTVITEAPGRSYTGYTYQNTDGVPLTVTGENHVVRVYYVTDTSANPAVNSNAKLFEDAGYKVEIKKSKSGYGVYGLLYVDVNDLIGKTRSINYSTSNGCSGRVNHTKTWNPYGNIKVTATATYFEGLPHTEANKNGQKITVNLVKDTAHSTEKLWVFKFPVNSRNNTGLAKAYIPINWKDGTDWTIQFNASITYDEYSYTTTARSHSCGGHTAYRSVRRSYTGSDGKSHSYTTTVRYTTYNAAHNYTYYTLDPMHTTPRSRTATGSASIRINGNMYEDDFTGGKH